MIRKDKAEGGTLYKHCRHKLKHRTRPVGGKRISIPNRTSISERPTEADGKRFGELRDGHDCWKRKPWCHRNTDRA